MIWYWLGVRRLKMYDASGTVLLKGTLTMPFLCISAPPHCSSRQVWWLGKARDWCFGFHSNYLLVSQSINRTDTEQWQPEVSGFVLFFCFIFEGVCWKFRLVKGKQWIELWETMVQAELGRWLTCRVLVWQAWGPEFVWPSQDQVPGPFD